ncbi:hypothetical protein ACWGRF_29935 [Streptomyces zhihengii]
MHERFPMDATAYRWAAQENDPSDTVPLIGAFHPGARHTWVASPTCATFASTAPTPNCATPPHWGFAHSGRFAADYRNLYGVSPSATLRGTP